MSDKSKNVENNVKNILHDEDLLDEWKKMCKTFVCFFNVNE